MLRWWKLASVSTPFVHSALAVLLLAAPTRTVAACDPATEVEIAGGCYYLDGSQGVCDPGYFLGSQAVLTLGLFAGKTYKHSVSFNCCIYNADGYADWGMGDHCNSPGPFTGNDPAPGAAGCSHLFGLGPGQLTLCTTATCGNGTVEPGEQCDAGAGNGHHGYCCTADCQPVPSGSPCLSGSCDDAGQCITPSTTTSTTIVTTTTTTLPPDPRAIRANRRAAVAYQITPGHSGSSPVHLSPPLKRRWVADLGGLIRYPLVAGGTVFVTPAVPNLFPMLHALDERTGVDKWPPVLIPGGDLDEARIAYDRGRVFGLTNHGMLTAFDAETGTSIWSTALPGFNQFTAAPTAADGIVFVGGSGMLFGISEADGSVLWSRPVKNGDDSSPAASSTGVYVSYSCEQVYGFSPVFGTPLWHFSGANCSGGGGQTPVLYNGRLYVHDISDFLSPPVVLDADSGAVVGTFPAGVPPAFGDGRGFFLSRVSGGALQATDLATGTVLWSFAGDGQFELTPIVARRNVFIGSAAGTVYALSAQTGQEKWSTNVPASIGASQNAITSLTAGGRSLIVGASNTPCCTSCLCSTVLVAYR